MATASLDKEHISGYLQAADIGLNRELVEQLSAQFESLGVKLGHCSWEPIFQGGSDRSFYRVRHPERGSWIVVCYSDAKEENAFYADIARFLSGLKLNVPQVVFHHLKLRLLVLEDLGEVSLHSVVHKASVSSEFDFLYKTALDQAFLLHQNASAPVKTMPGFDEKLYRWERNYFLENLVQRWAKIQLSDSEKTSLEQEGERMGSELMNLPRCVIHRDFQSQNLMVRNGTTWMIDFQGMRLGHAAYDVASLLYDPYVSMESNLRTSLLNSYGGPNRGIHFDRQFYQAASQRLMQALGAYGFLGLVKEKKDFLNYIPSGLRNLSDAMQHLGDMPNTVKLIERISAQ
jgi:N-acetylmuramate 1-kinase